MGDKQQHTSKEFIQKIDELIELSENNLSSNIKEALIFAENAHKIAQENFYTKGIADSLKQISNCYSYLADYGNVMQHALHSMELYQAINDLKGESDCLNILGGVYNFLQDYNKRLECNLKSLELRQKMGDLRAQLSSLNNIGDTYTVMGDYENALNYFNQCLSYELTDNMKAIVYYNVGEVNFFKKEYSIAKEFIQKGLEFALKIDYWQIIIASYQMEANIYLLNNQFKEAVSVLEKAKEIAVKKKSPESEYPIYEQLANAYRGLEDFKNAFFYLNQFNDLKTKVLNDNNAQKLKKIEFEFQFKNITSEAEAIKEKNKQLNNAYKKIEAQNQEIEAKNISITDSIHYAKRIQLSILPPQDKLKKLLPNSFVLYQPKDIVSGDFYWVEDQGEEILFSVIDCTGHGVPGAFVSLIAHNMLNKVVLERKITQPAAILNEMDEMMKELFSKSEEKVRDGVDMGICSYHTKTKELNFAGAFHSLFVCDGKELKEIKGNRESIGFSIYEHKKEFINHQIQIQKGNRVYLSSDGFPDQFGGEKGKKLKWKGLKKLICDIQNTELTQQKELIMDFFNQWKKDQEQLDDVCLMGVEFS